MTDSEHYAAIVNAIENGVKTLRDKGAPGDLLVMALMHVAVRIVVLGYGLEEAATRLWGQLDSLLKAEGLDETTH
jgi:hypothetical protein